jgi:hypothetical protein
MTLPNDDHAWLSPGPTATARFDRLRLAHFAMTELSSRVDTRVTPPRLHAVP